MARLADRLRAARARQFVGRADELGLFAQALDADVPPFALLWLYGPGGIGKTTLLRRFADDAAARSADVRYVDAAQIEASPRALAAAVGPVGQSARLVLLLDGAELLASLRTWLREEYLPGLPESAVVVVGGRTPPDERWRSDLGWADSLLVRRLGGLGASESADYLTRRGLPAGRQGPLIDAAHGHPLALALLADLDETPPAAAISSSADLVAVLLQRFVGHVDRPEHRRALHLLGHVRVTTQALLAAVLPDQEAEECFAWLRSLSFVNPVASGGLAPHDLAREVLDADLAWRDREGWLALRAQVRAAYLQRAADDDPRTRRRAVADLLWLNRDSPSLSAYPSWDDAFALWWEPATPADLPHILALATRLEGAQSADLHERWWAAQPDAFCVIRDRPGHVHAFFVQLRLDASGRPADLLADDPFAAAALAHVRASAPLRAGEHLRVVRSWMGHDGYHVPSPTHQALTGATTTAWLSEKGLAISVSYMAVQQTPDPWVPMFAHVDYAPAPAADVTFAGRRYAAYVHDWRARPPLEWLALVGRRQDGSDGAWTRAEFDLCVRDALRSATDARALAANPLSRARVVRDHPSADVRTVLEEAVARLRERPRGERPARVLEVTYFARASTQEAAAARLSLAFSTYRRLLATGIAAVIEDLWEREAKT